jgi:hypothetical protein
MDDNEYRDSWSWLENIKLSQRTKGIILVVIPGIILLAFGIYWYLSMSIFTKMSASLVTVTITNPPSNFLNPIAQIITGIGICMASICWGVSKIIKSHK